MHEGVFIDIFPCDNAFESELGRKLQFAASKIVIAKCLYKRGYETDNKLKKAFIQVCRIFPLKPMLGFCMAPKQKHSSYVHVFLGGASRMKRSQFHRYLTQKTERLLFENQKFPCYSEYDKLLRVLYGDYMVLPPDDERRVKKHSFLLDLDKPYTYYKDVRNNIAFDVLSRSIR